MVKMKQIQDVGTDQGIAHFILIQIVSTVIQSESQLDSGN